MRQTNHTNIEPLLELFCSIHNISVQDVKGRSRKNGLPLYRHIFAYIAKNELNATLKDIGCVINRNHDTVLHGIKNIEWYLSIPNVYVKFKRMVDIFSIVYNQSTEEAKLTESDHTTSESSEKMSRKVLDRLLRGRGL